MHWKYNIRIIYAHALENTVISYYLRTCAGILIKYCIKYSTIVIFTLMRWKYSYIILFTHMSWYFNKYCIKYSNIALFTDMRWKIQLSHYLRT
jgi:hypothetical protein